ncbi:MAG: hypothetical protein SGJ05_00860 [bacterium]|nr:hypothetical protein [bacterium]
MKVAASVGGKAVPDGQIRLMTVYLFTAAPLLQGTEVLGGVYVQVQYATSTLYVDPPLQNVTLTVSSTLLPGHV